MPISPRNNINDTNIAKDVNNKNNDNNNNNNINNNNNKRTKGILSSPSNPATLRRLSQANKNKDSNKNEVSWHKRVVVHRVPRSDASRSMFHAKAQESHNSNQCCIVL